MTQNEDFVNSEIEGLKRDLERLQQSMDALLENSRANQNGLNVLKDMVKEDHTMLLGHQKLLVIGNGQPSLMETVRNLTTKLSDFIENVKEERDRREKKEAADLLERTQKEAALLLKKEQDKTRWQWAIIGIVLPFGAGFIYQFFVFWVTIVPKLSAPP